MDDVRRCNARTRQLRGFRAAFGTPYNDNVAATSTTGSLSASSQLGPVLGSLGGELRTLDVASTMLASNAPHWQRLAGAWTSLHTSRLLNENTHLDVDASGRVDASSLTGEVAFSPRIAVGATRANINATVSLANGYAPPSLADQFFHEGVLVRANPALRAERTTGDLEARVSAHDIELGRLVVGAEGAVFRSDVDGMILWFPDFRFIWSPSNIAVHRSGWEFSGRAAVPDVGLELQGTLNHSSVEYAESVVQGQVVYRPRTTASVTAGAPLLRGRIELADHYVSSRRTVPGSSLNSLNPYSLIDARWTTSLARGAWAFDLGLSVSNVLDRPAAMLVDYPFPGRAWGITLRARRSSTN